MINGEQKMAMCGLVGGVLSQIRNQGMLIRSQIRNGEDIDTADLDKIIDMADGFHNIPYHMFLEKPGVDSFLVDIQESCPEFEQRFKDILNID